ncbi:hypothetical protein JXC34_07405 [Candidatus Woesearchaeota archaeon]|nr:hypothetical protein [Candidatus Woesearchaeota archaeon]
MPKKLNKKGIELSMNFIIGLIIGVVLFSLGLVFIYKIVSGVDEIGKINLPDTFKIEADKCVQRGERICIPVIRKEVRTREPALFGIIINNIAGSENEFQTVVKFSGYYEDGVAGNANVDVTKWTYEEFEVVELENNEHYLDAVPLQPPKGTVAGTYVFNIYVCVDDSSFYAQPACPSGYQYGPTHQVTVEVV